MTDEEMVDLWHKTDCPCEHCKVWRKVLGFTPKPFSQEVLDRYDKADGKVSR